MVGRRGLLGGAAAAAAVLLSGCGNGGRQLAFTAEDAASEIEGVSETELEMVGGATFERLLRGTVTLEPEDREGGLAAFDEAMRAIVTVVHDELDDAEARSVRVGWITGVLASGEELTPVELGPDTPAENPRRNRITAESFYEKYGLG